LLFAFLLFSPFRYVPFVVFNFLPFGPLPTVFVSPFTAAGVIAGASTPLTGESRVLPGKSLNWGGDFSFDTKSTKHSHLDCT